MKNIVRLLILFHPVLSICSNQLINNSNSTKSDYQNIIFACNNGDFNTVQKLLESGVDPNSKDSDGDTIFLIATQKGNLKLVELLIKYGADVSIPSKDNLNLTYFKNIVKNGKKISYIVEYWEKTLQKFNFDKRLKTETTYGLLGQYLIIDVVKLVFNYIIYDFKEYLSNFEQEKLDYYNRLGNCDIDYCKLLYSSYTNTSSKLCCIS